MKLDSLLNALDPDKKYIQTVIKMSEEDIDQGWIEKLAVVRLILNNGIMLSIVSGGHSYSTEGSYEVAVINNEGIDYSLTDGDVLTYQTPENIKDFVMKICA